MSIDLNSLLAALRAALPIAKDLAAITTTKWDDHAVAVLEAMLANETLLNFLRAILGVPEVVAAAGPARTAAIHAACEQFGDGEVRLAAEKAGLTWLTLLQYAPQVVTLVLTILGNRR